MKTKKIILSMSDYDANKVSLERIEGCGINILQNTFNTTFERYDIIMKVTKEQAYKLLDLANEIGAILWKGEH